MEPDLPYKEITRISYQLEQDYKKFSRKQERYKIKTAWLIFELMDATGCELDVICNLRTGNISLPLRLGKPKEFVNINILTDTIKWAGLPDYAEAFSPYMFFKTRPVYHQEFFDILDFISITYCVDKKKITPGAFRERLINYFYEPNRTKMYPTYDESILIKEYIDENYGKLKCVPAHFRFWDAVEAFTEGKFSQQKRS